jgi:hypothetical protein
MRKSNYVSSLDFEVVKCPIHVEVNGRMVQDSSRVALVNDSDDTVISYMSPSYRLFTNEEFSRLTERIQDAFGLKLNHYAVHNNGAKVLSVFDKADKIYRIGDYTFDNHIVLYDSRDGSTKLSIGGSGVLHRCMNMFTSTKVQLSVNHSSKLDQMLWEFSESLHKFEDEQRSYIEKINRLNDIRVYKDDLFELISGWTALKPQEVKLVAQGRHHGQKSLEGLSTRKINIINGISNAYDIECFGGSANGMNIQGVGENGFGLLNTITHYYTHNRDKSVTDLFFGDFGTKEQQTIKFAEQLA